MFYRRILHLDLDAFFVAVERLHDPTLMDRPVVVGGRAGGRGVVASASYEARAFGLRSGMPLVTAQRLCPQAVYLPGSYARYQEASERVMSILAEYTPDLEVSGIDEAYLDLTGFEPIYGSARETAQRIKDRIWEEVGLPASIGIASSAVVAKVAADGAKPNGLIEVLPGREREFLAPLPVGDLPCVGQKTEAILRGMGILTVGKLADQPMPGLRAVFGVLGETLHRFANGIDDRRIEPRDAPPKSISRSTTFAEDSLDFSFLSATLRYLTERVGAALRRQEMMARCVTLKVRYADFSTVSRSRTLGVPQDGDAALFGEALSLLRKALTERRQLVRLIGIGVSELVEEGRQLSLEDGYGERLWQLNQVVDRLRQKYGFNALQVGRTFGLRRRFPADDRGYVLQTPSLSR